MKRFVVRFLGLGLVFLGVAQTPALAQSVRDSAFCLTVAEHGCPASDVVPNRATVSLDRLTLVDGYPTLYFWSNLRNPAENSVAVFFSREGECYEAEAVSPDDEALRELSDSEQFFGILRTMTFGEIWRILGLGGADVGSGDVKVSVVTIPESNQYRVHTFRHAHCPGRFKARFIGSDGRPLPGANDVDIVLVR
jgi:hypothetical protein